MSDTYKKQSWQTIVGLDQFSKLFSNLTLKNVNVDPALK